MDGWSSTSFATAEQVSSPLLVLSFAAIVAAIVGRLLFAVTVALEVAVLPSESVAVMVQVTVSPGMVSVGSSVRDAKVGV